MQEMKSEWKWIKKEEERTGSVTGITMGATGVILHL